MANQNYYTDLQAYTPLQKEERRQREEEGAERAATEREREREREMGRSRDAYDAQSHERRAFANAARVASLGPISAATTSAHMASVVA